MSLFQGITVAIRNVVTTKPIALSRKVLLEVSKVILVGANHKSVRTQFQERINCADGMRAH
jgi:hypothetical protein